MVFGRLVNFAAVSFGNCACGITMVSKIIGSPASMSTLRMRNTFAPVLMPRCAASSMSARPLANDSKTTSGVSLLPSLRTI